MTEVGVQRGPYRTGRLRRAQILSAAHTVFARRGYAGSSLRRIADDVGVTPGGLLRHFGSKEGLLTAVLDQWELDLQALLDGSAEGLPWLAHTVDVMRYHEKHPGLVELYLTMCGESSDPDHPARPWIRRHYDRIVEQGRHHLRIAEQAGDVAPMSDAARDREIRALFALMDGLELQWITNPALDLSTTFAACLDQAVYRWRTGADEPEIRSGAHFP